MTSQSIEQSDDDVTTRKFYRLADGVIRELFKPEKLPEVNFELMWKRLWTRIVEEDEWMWKRARALASLPTSLRGSLPDGCKWVWVSDSGVLVLTGYDTGIIVPVT